MTLPKVKKKYLMVLVGVILAAEAVWAYRTLYKPTPIKTGGSVSGTPRAASKTVITLSSSKSAFKVGEQVPVSVYVSSDKLTDGMDLVIVYDPKLLSVVYKDASKAPMALGSLYSEYPVNSADETLGRIVVSGISLKEGGSMPRGIFGELTFQTKKTGATTISLEFTPGSTVDTNVIESKTAKDILTEVQNLKLNITP